MKPSRLPILAALAVSLASAMLTLPEAEAARRSGPSVMSIGPKAGAVVRDHRVTTGKLQCVGSYCPGAKVKDVMAPRPGKATDTCVRYQRGCPHPKPDPH